MYFPKNHGEILLQLITLKVLVKSHNLDFRFNKEIKINTEKIKLHL